MRRAAALTLALSLLAAGPALAHARLVSATPGDKAAVAAPARIALTFSEKLQAKFSNFELRSRGAAVPVTVSVGPDGHSLVGVPARPLAPGAYDVTWVAVTADTHRIEGHTTFTVR